MRGPSVGTCHGFYGVAEAVALLFSLPFLYSGNSPASQLETFSFSFVFWRVMGSSSCPLMDVYMDLVLLPILNSLLLVCWPGRLFLQLVANFDRIRFSPPAVSAGTGRGAISSQVRGRWQRHMAVNSRIECLDDDSRCPSLECLGCLCAPLLLFRVIVCGAARLLRSIDSPTAKNNGDVFLKEKMVYAHISPRDACRNLAKRREAGWKPDEGGPPPSTSHLTR